MAQINTATDANFEASVLNNPKPVMVDFWAAWCAPCRAVSPIIEAIAQKYDGAIEVFKLDVDANPGVSQALGISSIPVVALFVPGSKPVAVMGARPMADFEG